MYKLEFRKKIWLDPSIDEMNTHVEYLVYAQVLFIFDFFLKIFQKKTSFKQSMPLILNGFINFEGKDLAVLMALHHSIVHHGENISFQELKQKLFLFKNYCPLAFQIGRAHV